MISLNGHGGAFWGCEATSSRFSFEPPLRISIPALRISSQEERVGAQSLGDVEFSEGAEIAGNVAVSVSVSVAVSVTVSVTVSVSVFVSVSVSGFLGFEKNRWVFKKIAARMLYSAHALQ